MATELAAGSGTSSCGIDSIAQIYESDDELVVLVRLNTGLLELRVPRNAVPPDTPATRINGLNADATPC